MAYAIDKKKIVELVLLGEGKAAKVHRQQRLPNGHSILMCPTIPLASRKRIPCWTRPGTPRVPSGIRFKIRLSCIGGRGSDIQIAEVMRDQLKQVGIDAQIISTDRATFSDVLFMRWDFDIAIQQAATAPDPMVGLTRLIHSKNIIRAALTNSAGFSNPEVDKLLDEEYKQVKQRETGGHVVPDPGDCDG